MLQIKQGFIFVCNPFLGISFNQCLIQKLFLLMGHIRDQQAEKDMKPLNLASQCGGIEGRSV